MKTINGKHYYVSEEVCAQFGICRKTWIRWRARYNVRSIKVGNMVLFPAEELTRIIRENENYGAPDNRRKNLKQADTSA